MRKCIRHILAARHIELRCASYTKRRVPCMARTAAWALFLLAVISTTLVSTSVMAQQGSQSELYSDQEVSNGRTVFLPLTSNVQWRPLYYSKHLRVNAPRFDGEIRFAEMAVFWFGKVTSSDNYADVRVGYNANELRVRLGVFDRQVWYSTSPSINDLKAWDGATLYLETGNNAGDGLGPISYRFDAQMNWWEGRGSYQASYRGNGSDWSLDNITFTTGSAWRDGAPNDNSKDSRGWAIDFHIPFSSLGFSGAPPEGTLWRMGLELHDRDGISNNSLLEDKTWPPGVNPERPTTWGELSFGMPGYSPPSSSTGGTVLIRHKLNGASVMDGEVGGGTTCGEGLDYWNQWGDRSYPGYVDNSDFNIQNQSDIGDWPCFAKYYINFPLDQVPSYKVIISAQLTLYQWSNSGGGEWGPSPRSLLQVLSVAGDWDEQTLSWNNAPLALENIAAIWVDPLLTSPGWPGVARTWDVSKAVAEAYAARDILRLAVYSADSDYNSGKYFVSADTGDWNENGRPSLKVVWGEP